MFRIAIIGEFDPNFRPHTATNEALEHLKPRLDIEFEATWISTEHILQNEQILTQYHGFWIAPGSPYKNMQAAIWMIQQARLHKIPVLGTCGGFQHMAIEFARNVLGIEDAEHAEYDPYASKLVVNPLTCDLKGEPLLVSITDSTSKVYAIYQKSAVKEKYYCNFGLNPVYQNDFEANGFKIVGTDTYQEARILELQDHPFFVATLFVPQDNSSKDAPHPLVEAFLLASAQRILLKNN
ncbi:MAG TPA: CTP synthase [Microscillaceae bacterium]|nr:CTP synthase [Microscillaceae bacterium]